MSQTDFEEAFKKLESRVQYLEDKLIKQQRENADLLEQLTSLSDSGVSTALVGKLNKKFSEIVQTEGKIQSAVEDLSDDTRKRYSKIEQTAEKIETEVGAVYNEVLIGTNGNPVTNPEAYESYKGSLVSWNGNNYRYSSLLGKWEKVDGNSISSSFKQTAEGFYLEGDVKIDGNTYQNGNIYVTGKGVDKGSALYVCDGDVDNVAGFISFDSTGSGDNEAENRMLVAAEMGHALKILTYASSEKQDTENISIGAGMWRGPEATNEYSGYGYVYMSSPVVFTHFSTRNDTAHDVVFQDGCEVDFSNATVTGLYAVFE